MPHAVSIYLPHFLTDLIRRTSPARSRDPRAGARSPILVYREHAGRQIVVCGCAIAASEGVRPEMTVAHARALLEDEPRIVAETPVRSLRALRGLGRWAVRFTPVVAVDPPEGLMLDIAGCEHLHGGPRRAVVAMGEALARLGYAVRVAGAPTFAAAWAYARFGPRPVESVSDDNLHTTVGALPVEALDLEPRVAAAMHEVGVERIEHLRRLPRGSITPRYGADVLMRLDQMMGHAMETIEPLRPIASLFIRQAFDGPVMNIYAVGLLVQHLLGELGERLQKREAGAIRLLVTFDRLDAPPLTIPLALSRPSRDRKHLWSLLEPKLEDVQMGYGIEQVTISVSRDARMPHEQADAWPEGSDAASRVSSADSKRVSGELIDTLSNRLGPRCVLRVRLADGHLPEQSFSLRPALEPVSSSRALAMPVRAMEDVSDTPPCPPGDRPSQLFSRPEPVKVMSMTPDGPPKWMRTAEFDRHIVASAGPERISPAWWKDAAVDESTAERTTASAGPAGRTERSNQVRPSHRMLSYSKAYAVFFGVDPGPPATSGTTTQSITRAQCAPPPHGHKRNHTASRDYFKVQDETGRWWWVFRDLGGGGWFIHGRW